MGTYVTDTGFAKPSLVENNEAFGDAMKGAMGDSLDVGETTPAGLLTGMLAKTVSDAEDVDQELYTSVDPGAATGVALDRLCSIIGISRISAAAARCEVVCYTNAANDGLVVSPGKQVRRVRGGLVFSLPTALTISLSSCREVYLTLPSVSTGQVLTLFTSLETVIYTVPADSTPATVYAAVAAEFNALQNTAVATARQAGDGNLLNADCLMISSPYVSFLVTPISWVAELVGSAGMFVADSTGKQTVNPNEISEIVTPQANWLYARNLVAGIDGRAVETDEELRLRRERSFREGYATDDAIRQALLDRVTGVSAVEVVSNRTLTVDSEGRPPKSFEVVIDGGSNSEIANVIWQVQPAGIESFSPTGPVEGYPAIDSQGFTQYVKFSRPQAKVLDVRITYSLYSEEEFPGTVVLLDTLVAWALTEYTMGKDVIKGRIEAACRGIPGLDSVSAEMRWHQSGTPDPWGTTKLAVATRERASLAAENITLVLT